MTAPEPVAEDSLLGLQDEIRRVGRGARRIRRIGMGLAAAWFALALLTPDIRNEVLADIVGSMVPVWRGLWMLGLAVFGFGGMFGAASALLALLPAAVYRRWKRGQLRQAVTALSAEEAASALRPLRADGGDTRRLADDLLRDLPVPTEPETEHASGGAPPGTGRIGRAGAALLHLAAAAAYPGFMVGRWYSTWMRAKRLYEARRYCDAAQALRHYTSLYPEDPEGHHWLGNALGFCGQVEEAVPAFRRAAELEPGNAGYHAALGNALGMVRRHDEALRVYQRAVALKPNDSALHVALGVLEWKRGRREGARRAFQRALDLDPNSADARQFLRLLQRHPDRTPDDLPPPPPPTPRERAVLELGAICRGEFTPTRPMLQPVESSAKEQRRHAAAEAALILGELHLRHGDAASAVAYLHTAASSDYDIARIARSHLAGLTWSIQPTAIP